MYTVAAYDILTRAAGEVLIAARPVYVIGAAVALAVGETLSDSFDQGTDLSRHEDALASSDE